MNIFRKVLVIILIINFSLSITSAQIAINSDGSTPDASAMLEITSSDKGILIPRMDSTSRKNISSPATGLLVYDTDVNTFWYYANSTWISLNSILADTDNDTKIQVEESSDEDIIRFDLGGTEFMKLDSGRIEILNTGGSIFIGEGAGINDGYDNKNVFIGHQAGLTNITGINNAFVGYQAGYNNTTGLRNTFLGYQAGYSNTEGLQNTFTGEKAGYINTSGSKNIFTGYETGYNNTTGEKNVFIGNSSGYLNSDGYSNTVIGHLAGYSNVSGYKNVFLGFKAGYNETGSEKLYIENSTSTSPLIYGEFDNDLVRINGTLNINNEFTFPITDGSNANQILITDGSGTLSWSNNATIQDGDNDTKVDVSSSDEISFQTDGIEYFNMNKGRLNILNTGYSVFIGESAGQSDDLNNNLNVALGRRALMVNTSGDANMAIGGSSLENCTGNFNTAIGFQSGINITSGDENVIIGYTAGSNITTGSDNIIIGSYAGGSSNVSNKLFIDNSDTDDPLIYGNFNSDLLVFNGDVGIGVSPTKAKFEVEGYGSTQTFTDFGLYDDDGSPSFISSSSPALSIYASWYVAATGFVAFSDARIKNIQGISNSKNDLNTLMDIQITDYTMKDTITKGNQSTKKVIAQQVAEVYPQAVQTNLTDVIPNIYKKAIIENGWVKLTTDLEIGDKVQIIFKDKKELLEVLETKENAFRVKLATGKLPVTAFIYGKQVNDFHTVDYEAISMLNVSATQQLAKEVEQLELLVRQVRMENATLKEKSAAFDQQQLEIDTLKVQVQKINKLEAKLEALLNNQ